MNPIIQYEAANARIAELRRQAEHERAARQARLASKEHGRHPAPRWTRRVLILLGARGA